MNDFVKRNGPAPTFKLARYPGCSYLDRACKPWFAKVILRAEPAAECQIGRGDEFPKRQGCAVKRIHASRVPVDRIDGDQQVTG
jgi:hypothetical protein